MGFYPGGGAYIRNNISVSLTIVIMRKKQAFIVDRFHMTKQKTLFYKWHMNVRNQMDGARNDILFSK